MYSDIDWRKGLKAKQDPESNIFGCGMQKSENKQNMQGENDWELNILVMRKMLDVN